MSVGQDSQSQVVDSQVDTQVEAQGQIDTKLPLVNSGVTIVGLSGNHSIQPDGLGTFLSFVN